MSVSGYESDRCHLQGSQVISTQQFAGPQRGASKRSGRSQRSSVPKDWGVLEVPASCCTQNQGEGPGHLPEVTLGSLSCPPSLFTYSGAHVLGDHQAAEGDVTGQARLLPPRGLGHGPGPEGGSELETTSAPGQTDRRGPGASPEPEVEWRNKWPGLRGSTEPAPNVQPWTGPQEVTSSPPQ